MKIFQIALLCAVGFGWVWHVEGQAIPLITDPNFERGFEVLAPNHPPTVEGDLQWDASGGPPVWTLAQWDSQSTISGVTPTQLPSGVWRYANDDKEIIAGGGPTAGESDLVLAVNGVNEYGGQFRGPGDPWPHLLVEQRISDPGGNVGSRSPSIAEMSSLDFQIDARLLYDNRTTTGEYNPSIHASQYNIYYTVQNLNQASSGFGDFLWFGTTLYDDRDDVTGLVVLLDSGTQKLIYNIGIEPFTSERIADGNWISLEGDLLPHMKAGLQEAWNRDLMLDSQDYADYRIGGVNLGWEMPGLNDASLQIRNYNVVANLLTISEPGDMDDDGDVDFDDIDDFVLGLIAPQDYENQFGVPPEAKGDMDGDGDLDFDDISGFVVILTPPSATGPRAIPEPSTILLTAMGLFAFTACGWRRHRVFRLDGD